MQGVDQNFRALAQHFVGRGHVVGNAQQIVGNPQQGFGIALHGSHGGEQMQQAAPALERHAAHFRAIAGVEGALGRGHDSQDGDAHFRGGVF